MAIDWKGLNQRHRLVFLARLTYRPDGGGGDQTLYLCHQSGASEAGFYDFDNQRQYYPYIVSFETDERWPAIEPIPEVPQER